MMNIDEIKKILPHREPMLMVDEVVELVEGKYIVAKKTIPDDEYFLQGHFPKFPIVPGVLIAEAISQAGGILLYKTIGAEGDQSQQSTGFAGFDKCRFRSPVYSNEIITLRAEIDKMNKRICKFKGTASVEGMLVAEANFVMVNKNPLENILDKY